MKAEEFEVGIMLAGLRETKVVELSRGERVVGRTTPNVGRGISLIEPGHSVHQPSDERLDGFG